MWLAKCGMRLRKRMAKLYFRYGTVGSAKTLNLLAVAHNYEQQDKRVLVVVPALDVRYGKGIVRSRAGLERVADVVLTADQPLTFSRPMQHYACVLVDEAQFMTKRTVRSFRETADQGIPVICYGLRTSFKQELFPGSSELLALADTIEEVKTTCHICNKKAVFNLRSVGGVPVFTGHNIQLGGDESYKPACSECYESLKRGVKCQLESLPKPRQ